VNVNGTTYGPYSGHKMRAMVGKGQLTASDLVHSEDGTAWVQAEADSTIGSLFRRPQAHRRSLQKLAGRAEFVLGLFVLIAIGWLAWPYITLYKLGVAVSDGDSASLEVLVSWGSVRQGLRGDLNAALLAQMRADAKSDTDRLSAGLTALIGPAVINQMIDSYVTPQGIATLIRTGKPAPAANPTVPTATARSPQQLIQQVQYAFFSGGPFTFRVDFLPESDASIKSPMTLLFQWFGTWRLTSINLPRELLDGMKSAGGNTGQRPVR
jgi:hypothetical protein